MIIFYVLLAANSEFDIRFASSHLDLDVTGLWMFFYVFLDQESEKSIRNTLSCLLFAFSLLSKIVFVQNKKYQKIKK